MKKWINIWTFIGLYLTFFIKSEARSLKPKETDTNKDNNAKK